MYLYGRETERASFPVNVSRSKTPYVSFSTSRAREQALRSLFWPRHQSASESLLAG